MDQSSLELDEDFCVIDHTNMKYLMQINVATQVTIVGTKFTVKNVGKQVVNSIEFCHKAEHIINAAVFEVGLSPP